MHFGVLGPLAVWTADGESTGQPVSVPELKVRTVLAALLAQPGQPLSADRLIDYLWGAAPPAKATNTLQTKVSQLRRVLDAATPGGRNLLTLEPAGYVLALDDDALDAHQFTTLTAQARTATDPRPRADLFAQALALWRGPAFADFRQEPFALAAIGRLEEQRVVALEEQAEARLELGEDATLAAELDGRVAAHPRRERLRAAHMRALYRAGRPSEALDSFHDLRSHLADELGLNPGPDLAALQQAILEQDPALGRAAASDSGPTPRTNLPAPLTDLIGRDSAVKDIQALVGTERLVTLTGPGGVGKTRLAMAVGSALGTSDGVWLVELGALPATTPGPAAISAADIADHLAGVLGIRDDVGAVQVPGREAVGTAGRLASALRETQTLLVLDNCEHVIEPVADLAQRLLAAAPRVRILATSREPLGVPGEVVWAVPPLALPSPLVTDPDVLQSFSAAGLFLTRASAAAPGFALTSANAASVTAICRRLDGIPLALELAASRVHALGVDELATRLDDRFRLLSAGKRGVPVRQRTLWAMIDWSWQLLSDAEQGVLRRLAVHADGASLAAVEAVCAGSGVAAEDVAELLSRLVDRSLVVAGHDGSEARYSLLESVAAYCWARLDESGESLPVRHRHGQYYLELAELAEPELYGAQQRTWLVRLTAESANLRRAFDAGLNSGDAELCLRLDNALAWYWYLRGRRHEAIRFLAHALEVSGPAPAAVVARAHSWHAGLSILGGARRAEPTEAVLKLYDDAGDTRGRARAQWLLGYAEFGFGNLAASERLVSDALDGFRRNGDRWGVAAALGVMATQAIFRGDLPEIQRRGQESATLFEQLGDGWGRLLAISALGTHAEITGDYAGATALYRDGLRVSEYLELWSEQSTMLARLGRIALLRGDYAQADQLHEQARRLAVQHSNTPGEEFAAVGLALSARRQGELDTAEAHLRHWLGWNRQVEAEYGVALILAELGFIAELRGDAGQARALHLDGLAAARSTGDPRAVALALEGLAGAEALAGEYVRAAQLLGAAAANRDTAGAPLPAGERTDVNRITARLRAELGAGPLAEYLRRGADLGANRVA